jgi:glycosyltransferase involved in cell wall biosynthesis
MIKLNIVTRCTRPQFLQKVKESIFKTVLFDIKWWVVFDTRVIKDIDADFLTSLQLVGGQPIFLKGEEGDMAHSLLSKVIDQINDGFVYFLDDDNIMHENFYDVLYKSIKENPEKRGFIFSQKVGGVDFTGLDIREAKPENTKVQGIDMAQFLLRRDLIGDIRFVPGDYKADGYFIEKIYNLNKDDFHFISDVLCYYNFLKKPINFTPKVLYIGADEPKLKSWKAADYESDELRVFYRKNDSDLQSTLKDINPDSIVTCSDDWSKFSNLSSQPVDIRSRWIHIKEAVEATGENAYQCAMSYILNTDNKKELVSYFTPIYNTGTKLKQAYSSLQNQTNYNWEWVLVNDSTDGGLTLKIAEELARNDNRVKLYDFREKSGGIVGEYKYRAAMMCSGEILAEFDHDDYLLPTCTETLLKASKKYPECGFFYTDCVEIDNGWNSLTYGDGFAFGYGSYRDEVVFGKPMQVAKSFNINPKTIRHIVGVPNHVRAWRRSAYFNAGCHNRRLSIADDYELVIRTFLTTKMLKIPRLEYLQFIHNDGGNTHNISRADIQRRVRTIAHHYSLKIKSRFEELGLKDWAYETNPDNPTWCDSKFDEFENAANLTFED